jgi:hypothetical protein
VVWNMLPCCSKKARMAVYEGIVVNVFRNLVIFQVLFNFIMIIISCKILVGPPGYL